MSQLSSIWIQGILQTRSPLSIGTGLSFSDQQASHRADALSREFRSGYPNLNSTALVIRDSNGLPYIPGSVIKNAVRRSLTRLTHFDNQLCTADDLARLLGSGANQDHRGGCVMFYPALLDPDWLKKRHVNHPEASLFAGGKSPPWWDESQLSYVDVAVAINRRTGAAARHFLAFREVLPKGLSFRFCARVDHPDDGLRDTQLVLKALEAINAKWGQSAVAIGAESGNGWGLLRWIPDQNDRSQPYVVRRGWRTENKRLLPVYEPAAYEQPIWPAGAVPVNRVVCSAAVQLMFDGPFLVLDPAYRSPKKEADYRPLTASDGSALLPASGFRGVFRSALERIVHTINGQLSGDPLRMADWVPAPPELREEEADDMDALTAETENLADGESDAADDGQHENSPPPPTNMLHQLLGSSEHRSGLYCTDFVGRPADAQTRHPLEMVAIDRLTGGASAGAKFKFEVFERPTLTGDVRVEIEDSRAGIAALGLLAMGIRDLCQGDLAFGYGTYKGFGSCTAQITACTVHGLDHSSFLAKELSVDDGQPLTDEAVNEQIESFLHMPDTSATMDALDSLLDKALATARGLLRPLISGEEVTA